MQPIMTNAMSHAAHSATARPAMKVVEFWRKWPTCRHVVYFVLVCVLIVCLRGFGMLGELKVGSKSWVKDESQSAQPGKQGAVMQEPAAAAAALRPRPRPTPPPLARAFSLMAVCTASESSFRPCGEGGGCF